MAMKAHHDAIALHHQPGFQPLYKFIIDRPTYMGLASYYHSILFNIYVSFPRANATNGNRRDQLDQYNIYNASYTQWK